MSNTNNKPDSECNCNCQDTIQSNCTYPVHSFWHPNCVPPPYPPPPPIQTEGYYQSYPCSPVSVGANSIESQIAKLAKKSSVIRKMINGLINCNKSIIISIGKAHSYNFGTNLDAEGEQTAYAEAVLEILNTELEAIKTKIAELSSELEVADENTGGIENTVVGTEL